MLSPGTYNFSRGMPRHVAREPRTRRRWSGGEGLSTAFLLPDLHPWLKEYFADRNLVPLRDEAWSVLPEWEGVPTRESGISESVNQESTRSDATTVREREALRPEPVEEQVAVPLSVPSTPLRSAQEVPSDYLAAAVAPPTPEINHSSFVIRRSSFPADARPSASPVPFVIPVHAAAPLPSRHLLRIARPQGARATMSAPNFVAALRQGLEPIRNVSELFRTAAPAPMLRVPPPWNELLIVNIVGGTLGVLWRDLLWPLWSALRIPHPSTLARSFKLQAASFELNRRTEAVFRIKWRREQTDRAFPSFQPLDAHRLPLAASRLQLARPAFAFGLALTMVLIPLKLLDLHAQVPEIRGRVLSATAEAVGTFRAGGSAIAHSSFAEAIAAFGRSRAALEGIPDTAGPLGRAGIAIGRRLPGFKATLGRAEEGRRAGIALAEASAAATRGLAVLEAINLADPNAPTFLNAAAASFATARRHAVDARTHVAAAVPALVHTIDRATNELRRAERLIPMLIALGGIDRPRRLLLVFQNPAELRPTGGFMGSVALVDVAGGRVTSLELPEGGTYDLSGLTKLRVIPPEPLRLVSPTWQFHDANWFPDFPTSARKLRWFYEASGGPSVDAVVAVNAPVLEDILTLTGPITVGDQAFSATAVRTILTDNIESAAARASGRPKAIVATLAPEVLRRLLAITEGGSPTQRIELIDRMVRALEERDVLLAFTDDAAQRHAVEARWAGEVRAADRDALMVVHTNIGGGKSDGVIRDAIQHTVTILEDGSIVDRVQVTRTHEGVPAAATATPSERLAGLANVDYLRLYVPRGAALLTAEGFEPPPPEAFEAIPTDAIPDRLLLATELGEAIDPSSGVRVTEEFGRTVFGGWLQTPTGETRSASVVYRLPWRYERSAHGAFGRTVAAGPQSYALTIQKQPGTRATVSHSVTLAPTWRTTWTSENLMSRGSQIFALEDILTTDLATGMMVSPND